MSAAGSDSTPVYFDVFMSLIIIGFIGWMVGVLAVILKQEFKRTKRNKRVK